MIKRIRTTPKKLVILLVAMIPVTGSVQEKKNVLLLMADDFNHWTRAIGYYEQSQTPNIDKLDGRGVLFTEGHCTSPVCIPSRNAFLSGYRPTTTGISANSHGFVREKAGFEEIVNLHQYFKNEGYFVYGAGKVWHPGRMDYSKPECDLGNWTRLNTNSSGCQGGSYSHFEATSEKFTEFVWGGNTDVEGAGSSAIFDELLLNEKWIEIKGNRVDINSFRFTHVDNVGGIFEVRDDGSKAILDNNRIDNHTLHLDLTSMNPMLKLRIYFLDGKQLEEEMIPGELHLAYDMKKNLDHGLYILRVSDGENDRSERFLIE